MYLSYDILSGSEIRPCNKIDSGLQIFGKRYNVHNNVHNDKIIRFLHQKCDFKVILIMSYDKYTVHKK